ncbi:uncharacterized protein L3040_002451 [Drepanopeziza brunnea f. sp. 'multigermtubi']|uniref:uncharacterized protein n=1 Tax=Drepanopeziza brunnea f. sp. 'multigermtubi' TaxID=698441 RepID=UPI0023A2FE5F|nr:hypothetical protein L3040_002451 [Drepanopeziza brunnea f. sp. 'multigermtubi']
MGKTAPPKKRGVTSVRSRESRRAASPGIDLDKSLKDLKPPTATKIKQPSVLAIHQGAGISKKTKNGRKAVLSAKAKKRQEKGMDRAEAVIDKKEIKIEKSKDRARTVQERAKNWEELNKRMLAKKAREEADKLEEDKESEAWEDDEMEADEDLTAETNVAEDAKTIPVPAEEDEEIL